MPLVLAYHGCDLKTAQKLLGGSPFQPSARDYDWLGAGNYFWENDVLRAYQWATEARRRFIHPSVVGAVIDLRNCLDLTTQSGIEAVKLAYRQFIAMAERDGVPFPENVDPAKGASGDKILRRLDCAVMNHLFDVVLPAMRESDPKSQPYATVRALFPEGFRTLPRRGFSE